MRGLIDTRGEQFAYQVGDVLYTLDGEPTGTVRDQFVVDLNGQEKWRIVGDAVYTLDGAEAIGYFSSHAPDELDR